MPPPRQLRLVGLPLTPDCDLELDGRTLGVRRDTPSWSGEQLYVIKLKIHQCIEKLQPGQEMDPDVTFDP